MKCSKGYELQALRSNMIYIGTLDEDGLPNCRCSVEYYKTMEEAQKEIYNQTFKFRDCPENFYCNGGCK